MPSIDDLLAKVRENPADDSARLILADALLESNDPMGAFITPQFKAAAEKTCGTGSGRSPRVCTGGRARSTRASSRTR